MRTPILNLITAALLAASSLQAQATADGGKQVIDRALAALGGERFLHMRNRVVTGRVYSFYHNELNGLDRAKIYVEYKDGSPTPAALQLRERELFGKKGDYSFLFTPTDAYELTFRGARPFSADDWNDYQRSTRKNILYIFRTRLNEPGLQFDYIGSEVYLSRHVEIVDVIDAQNETVRVYFDHNTGLPVHETYTWLDEKTRLRMDEVTELDKYRDIGGGVMWPYSVERERNGFKTSQVFADEIQVDQPTPAAIFDLPGGAKVLPRAK